MSSETADSAEFDEPTETEDPPAAFTGFVIAVFGTLITAGGATAGLARLLAGEWVGPYHAVGVLVLLLVDGGGYCHRDELAEEPLL